mmetsp:Transcript_446/g.678  ORF Transcript_446/g.678 Transcript_446/m.678 type:complete len:151 (-) Transcript_446:215-667(-)
MSRKYSVAWATRFQRRTSSSQQRRTLSSSSSRSRSNHKVAHHGRQQTNRTPFVALTTTGMISLSAVAVSPLIIPFEQETLKHHSTSSSNSIQSRSKGIHRELSDLYTPTNRVSMFTGMEVVAESKQLEAEIDEMMLRLGQNKKDDGKIVR